MARVGVLSDLAVKQRYIEYFPLDVGGQALMHPIHLQKMYLKELNHLNGQKDLLTYHAFQ
jgi:hypothetical protein